MCERHVGGVGGVCVCVRLVCPLMLLSPGWALMDHFLPVALLALLVFKEECN